MITQAEFRTAILPFTLQHEGGFSLDRHDPGNWTGGGVGKGRLAGTRYGIAAASHPWLDIEHLGLEQACDIYWRDYVLAPGFARLDLPLLMVVFDAAVNCGPARAGAWLKRAASMSGLEPQIEAVTAMNLAFHRRLRTWPRYGTAWSARIAACRSRALLLAAAAPLAITAHDPVPAPHAPRAVPRAAAQPPAGILVQLIRVLADALSSRLNPGVRSCPPTSPR